MDKTVKKKTFTRIAAAAAFLSLLVLLLFLAQAVLVPKYMSFPYDGALVREYYDSVPEHDVVFFGDCEFYEAINPAVIYSEYGIPTYVRGSSQQLIWDSYYFLLETLEYEKPKVVVFNAVEMKIGSVQREEYTRLTLDGMRLSKYKLAAAKLSLTEDENIMSYVFPILRYHGRWSSLTSEDFRYAFKRDTVGYNGYMFMSGIKAKTSTALPPPLISPDLPDICWEYLELMRKTCEDNGIEFVIFKAPTDTWHYPWYDEWDAQLVDYSEKHGVKYLNAIALADEIGTDWSTDSYDGGDHLNYIGAEKISVFLGKVLKEAYGLEDRRGDADFAAASEWKNVVGRYLSAKAEAEKTQNKD
ncbi:MAG: SGNH/GDSL hydrolase family protein [Clostridia bacterium]|nr:SGNH/GDSL hydrolase family protein [Clostridia bacterium]